MLAVMIATGTLEGMSMAFRGVQGNPDGDLFGLTKQSSGLKQHEEITFILSGNW
jgi:hypothetical protein